MLSRLPGWVSRATQARWPSRAAQALDLAGAGRATHTVALSPTACADFKGALLKELGDDDPEGPSSPLSSDYSLHAARRACEAARNALLKTPEGREFLREVSTPTDSLRIIKGMPVSVPENPSLDKTFWLPAAGLVSLTALSQLNPASNLGLRPSGEHTDAAVQIVRPRAFLAWEPASTSSSMVPLNAHTDGAAEKACPENHIEKTVFLCRSNVEGARTGFLPLSVILDALPKDVIETLKKPLFFVKEHKNQKLPPPPFLEWFLTPILDYLGPNTIRYSANGYIIGATPEAQHALAVLDKTTERLIREGAGESTALEAGEAWMIPDTKGVHWRSIIPEIDLDIEGAEPRTLFRARVKKENYPPLPLSFLNEGEIRRDATSSGAKIAWR